MLLLTMLLLLLLMMLLLQLPNLSPLSASAADCCSCLGFLFLQTEVEDAVFIWSSEGSAALNLSQPHHRRTRGGHHHQHHHHYHTSASAVGPCHGSSGSAGAGFVLDCVVPLEDTASALVWLDMAGLAPLLAVGYGGGLVEMFSRDHR
jgi:hypothetical protein